MKDCVEFVEVVEGLTALQLLATQKAVVVTRVEAGAEVWTGVNAGTRAGVSTEAEVGAGAGQEVEVWGSSGGIADPGDWVDGMGVLLSLGVVVESSGVWYLKGRSVPLDFSTGGMRISL